MKTAVVDLFCGIGGLTKGLEFSGLNVVAGIDCEASCQYAYEANNCARFINEDITKISGEQLLSLYPRDTNIHILAGCAPCQPFSKYTHRYRKKGYQDDKWKLLYSFSRLVRETKPEIVTMENVPDLLRTNVFKDFVNNLHEFGYYVDYDVVFCPDYGIPQKRKRLVLIASIFGKIRVPIGSFTPNNYVTVRDAIVGLNPICAGETDKNDILHTATSLSVKNLKRIRQSVPSGTWRDWDETLRLPCHNKTTGKSYPSVYGRMSWDKPSPTITTQFYGYGNGRFGHPEQDRAISIREGAILQSFPKDYKFVASKKQINKRKLGMQIGNAVPVKLAECIGVQIIKHINEVQKNEEK